MVGMTKEETTELMLLSGIVHDIAEKSHCIFTQKQLGEVQKRIERLIDYPKYLHQPPVAERFPKWQ